MSFLRLRVFLAAAGLAVLPLHTLPAAPALAAEKEDQSVDMDDDAGRSDEDSGRSRDSDRGYLGVSVQRLRHNLKMAFDIPEDVDGLLVSKVYEGSPADRAGLRDKDVVVRFNGEAVDDETEFTRMIRDSRPGSQATLEIWRDGKRRQLSVTLSSVGDVTSRLVTPEDGDDDSDDGTPTPGTPAPPAPPDMPRALVPGGDHGYMGVVLQDLNKDIAGYFSLPDDRGALIWKVNEDSPAEKAGLKAGDVVTAVDGKEIRDSQDLRQTLADYKAGETVSLSYLRRGRSEKTEVKLDEGSGTGYMFGSLPGFEGLRRMTPGRNMQMNRRRQQDPSAAMQRLQRQMERLQEEMNRLKEDLERLKD